MKPMLAFTASSVFTGKEMLHHHTVVVQNDRIHAVLPTVAIRKEDYRLTDFGEAILCPALVDLQIYGAEGRLLSAFPDRHTVAAIVRYSKAGGAAWCLPTVASQPYEVMRQCIDAVADYWEHGGQHVLGLHLEGPWLNPEKRGAHVASYLHEPNLDQVVELLEYGKGIVKMITLAPECVSDEVLAVLQRYEVVLSAGHSNARYEQAMETFGKGIGVATHLFNAMSGFHHREAGLAGAVLNHPQVRAGIIPDGLHVSWPAVKLAHQLLQDRIFAITDAVTPNEKPPYAHEDAGDHYQSGGVLSGSKLTMLAAAQNLHHRVGLPLATALNMCSLHPARVLNLGDTVGLLKKGYCASMLVLNAQLQMQQMIDACGEEE